ncbi:hypothetical protein [Photobacterium leiognathi]|uniref:hypothetical protein n=1 Tax=Photobacterium leiognathi TaxID=553611 RepID=UPI0034E97710
MDELMTLGEKTYVLPDARCHQANGQGIPGHFQRSPVKAFPVDPKRKLEHISAVVHGKSKFPLS